MPRRPTPFVALALVLALLVAACGAPPPPEPEPDPDPEPTVLEAVYTGDPTLLPMAVAMVAFDEAVLPATASGALAPSDVELAPSTAELAPGLWMVGSAFVGQDGGVALELLDEDELPEGVLVPAAMAFQTSYGGEVPAGCTIAADDAEARVMAFGVAASLGSIAPALVGFTPAGTEDMVFTPTAADLDDPLLTAFTLIGFVYADRPVTFTSSGTCSDAGQDLTVDVALDTGWNRVAYRFTDLPVPVTVVMEADAGTVLRLQPLP